MLQSLKPQRKRKRSSSPTKGAKRVARSPSPSDVYKSRRSPSPVRKQKRPGQRARIGDSEREAIRQKQIEREKEIAALEAAQGIHNAVREHYNAVPQRGREWRKTDNYTPGAQERGSRGEYQFAEGPDPSQEKGLLVLDIGCGKGADISIDQAKERYREMKTRGGGRGGRGRGGYNRQPARIFHGEFFTQDCFGESIERIPIVREVGFDSSGGPGRFGGGGFDVVSMMFCLHYAFESEAKARTMLKNVSGALKKGGRLIGCIPNSHVISDKVEKYHAGVAAKAKAAEAGDDGKAEEKIEDNAEDGEIEEGEAEETAHWGNEVYQVRFPDQTPADGVFKPPFGWKYNFFLHEAVEEVPEYVVPWEAFRAIAEDYNLELQYQKPFNQIWETEKDDDVLGPLSERMNVRERGRGKLLVSDEEMEAASFYVGFCFYKV
ncbi:hypothetical protein EYC84_009373 [Monilinia fructicola]|uniref:mRNA cap guanine-N(7) methyltransferase n=1 Tax=Monilinia fructicola TaxID=38448 RepID=A0A5M9JEA5_MONFR|nr:hypothetical protein EYC84_009373 [Monilinia fructicola]